MRLTLIAAAAIAASLAVSPAAAQDAPLRVAIYNLTPFGADPPGGYCFELMNEIAVRTGLTIASFHPMGVPDMIPSVANGTVDILCSALAPNNERRGMGVVFTGPLFVNGETIVIHDDNAASFRTLAEMRDLRIAANSGSANLRQLEAAGHPNIVVYEGNQATGAELVLAGQADALLTNAAEFRYNQDMIGLWADLKNMDGYVPTRVSYAAIAVRPGDTALLGTIQAAIELLKLDGYLVD